MNDALPPALLATDRPRLLRAATRLLGAADAEDAVQDAYLRALQASATELRVAPAWLLTVVRHLAIDRLRRREWMQQWLARAGGDDIEPASASAEADAEAAQETARALTLLATQLSPTDGAAVLLHAVFEASHAEIAAAGGRTEAGSRQQLRRALQRLRQAAGAPRHRPRAGLDADEAALFQHYLQALLQRDPQVLWALLQQPAVRAVTAGSAAASVAVSARAALQPPAPRPHTGCGVLQVGARLALVLTLDGVTLCVLPLGSTDAVHEALNADACAAG